MKNKTVHIFAVRALILIFREFLKSTGRINSAASFTMIIKTACPKEKHSNILIKFLALYRKYLINLPTFQCFVNTGCDSR